MGTPKRKNASRISIIDEKIPEGQEMVFCGLNQALDTNPQIGAGQINRIYERIAKKAGLDELVIQGISVH